MTKIRWSRLLATVVLLVAASGSVAFAEEVEKRWRVGLAVGQYDTKDDVRSNSGNLLILVNRNDIPVLIFEDPRNDAAAIGALGIKPAIRVAATVQYAFSRLFVLEGSVGYQKGDVGDIEVQAQFNDPSFIPTSSERYRFNVFGINAGEMTQVPVEITALARFRPKATLNPFIGIGAGFTFIGFDPSAEFDQLSLNMDNSRAQFAQLAALFPGGGGLFPSGPLQELSGAAVDARDTFAWHLAGGAEFAFKKNWSAFVDLRYTFASRSMSIGFNGGESLGVSVHQGTEDFDSIFGSITYGAMSIPAGNGGLVDGGQLVPIPGAPPGTDCSVSLALCMFSPERDGIVDPGFYYVQGGKIKYGGPSLKIGIRYTF